MPELVPSLAWRLGGSPPPGTPPSARLDEARESSSPELPSPPARNMEPATETTEPAAKKLNPFSIHALLSDDTPRRTSPPPRVLAPPGHWQFAPRYHPLMTYSPLTQVPTLSVHTPAPLSPSDSVSTFGSPSPRSSPVPSLSPPVSPVNIVPYGGAWAYTGNDENVAPETKGNTAAEPSKRPFPWDLLTPTEGIPPTRRQEPPRFNCEGCGKSYATFSGLTKHKRFHCTSEIKREFSCKFCDKTYSSLGALKMHIRTHTLPCKCPLCGKAFSRPWLLQGHIRTHTGEKPFKCQHCARAFADRSNLRAHLQTHAEIKKYSCKSCSKTFSRMSLLLKHEDGGCGKEDRVWIHRKWLLNRKFIEH